MGWILFAQIVSNLSKGDIARVSPVNNAALPIATKLKRIFNAKLRQPTELISSKRNIEP